MRRIHVLTLACVWLLPHTGPTAETPAAERIADYVRHDSSLSGGIGAVVGANGSEVALALADRALSLVHVIAPSREAADRIRADLTKAGVPSGRAVVEHLALAPLPYADNLLDTVIVPEAAEAIGGDLSAGELLRVLRPGGIAIVSAGGSRLAGYKLEAWLRDADAEPVPAAKDMAGLTILRKPWPTATDEWPQWQHGPDMNPVSTDEVIRAPYLTQFLSLPFYSPMPSISVISGGRQFRVSGHMAIHDREEQFLNTLFATSAFNGRMLWTRRIPEGFLVHRAMMVATPKVLYLLEPRRCLVLDAATGAEVDTIEMTAGGGFWRSIVMDGTVLYCLLGEEEADAEVIRRHRQGGAWGWDELSEGYYARDYPWGYGKALVAYDTTSGRTLWTYGADTPIDSRALCMAGGRIFLHGEREHIRALDAKSGDVLWELKDPRVLAEVMEENEAGLGFKTTPYAICADDYLFFAGRGRKNVVALSAVDGKHLWTISGAYNSTNLLFSRGHLYAHIPTATSIDPATGALVKDLQVGKRSCARFTGCPDSLFHRGSLADNGGEGTIRYDAVSEAPTVIRAFRPACNDGIIPAEGLLHVTQWDCDCNLQLMGGIALAPAGDFEFRQEATGSERLDRAGDDAPPLEAAGADWPTYLADNSRTGSSAAAAPAQASVRWTRALSLSHPTAPVIAGGLMFVGADDGSVHALAMSDGAERWVYYTGGPVRLPPTITDDRAYVGSADGYVHCLAAATGKLLWRFRAAPVDRRIMVYGSLSSTWPVNSGVLVADGTAYAAAGIINYDGTHVYALDARTGALKWQNNGSGHLNQELREGASVQGCLAAVPGGLLLAGGNILGPTLYSMADGACASPVPDAGWPGGARGSEVGAFAEGYILAGGRRMFTDDDDPISNWQGFFLAGPGARGDRLLPGRVPPARDGESVVCSGAGPLVCATVAEVLAWSKARERDRRLQPAWACAQVQDSIALAMAKNAALAVGHKGDSDDAWVLQAVRRDTGDPMWAVELPGAPVPSGLAVADAGMVVVLADGTVVGVR